MLLFLKNREKRHMTVAAVDVRVKPLSAALGAEIAGVDLSRELDSSTVKAIEEAWYEHLVILFRGQSLSNEDQVRFCRHFGDLEHVRTGKHANEDMPFTMMITNVGDTGFATALENGEMWFHSDQCYYEVPARASTLYAIEIPSRGGNTLFANCYTAWETLPEDRRRMLAPLAAHHIYDYSGNPLKRGAHIDPDAPQFVHPPRSNSSRHRSPGPLRQSAYDRSYRGRSRRGKPPSPSGTVRAFRTARVHL